MSLILTLIAFFALFDTLNGQCGDVGSRLKMQISGSLGYAGTDGKILANVLVTGGDWTGWRRLDSPDCDDFTRGNTDYFDDFDHIPSIDAIQLHNCGNDGLHIETLGWRFNDDTNHRNKILFCETIHGFGASVCFVQTEIASSTGPCGGTAYSDVWIDGDISGDFCRTIAIDWTSLGSFAEPYFDSIPDPADCTIVNDPICDPFNGIVGGEGSETDPPVCCPVGCGSCCGSGCGGRPGGGSNCCCSGIKNAGNICGVNGQEAPCNIDPTSS